MEARLVLPMINEAAFCLEDRVVSDPGKLDLAMIFGTGFPPFRGGLLRHADAIGLARVFARLDDLAERLGPRFTPADSLQRLANERRGFYQDSPTSSREIAP
jgi:3-hydroxyacyl-CoA dehydrogenase/enoyl-CoA hydratase/3-hydroxybutyryl-CoA epimerase